MIMEYTYQYGYPTAKRIIELQEACKSSTETHSEEYQGHYRPLKVAEVRIEMLMYRIENIRTKSLQKEYLAKNPDAPKDMFTADPYSIETQETQHQLLKSLVDKEGLMKTFKKEMTQQTEPIICSDEGVVVNGNRRLCAWRELYYSDKTKYKHFQTVKVAVLPNHDPQGIYDLEVALQIRPSMKDEYSWHAIAADCKEKAETIDIRDIAKKQNKSPDEVSTLIECYDYATQYLEAIEHPNEWSRVEKQFFAFKGIISGRKSLKKPGDKELFQEIAQAILQMPVQGERLYSKIPKVVSCLDRIAEEIQEAFDITIDSEMDDDLALLSGGEADTDNKNAQIAAGIHEADKPDQVVQIVDKIIKADEDLEKEKKKRSFVFDQVLKAVTNLNNAVSNMDDAMSRDGIAKQLDNIEFDCSLLRNWIEQ